MLLFISWIRRIVTVFLILKKLSVIFLATIGFHKQNSKGDNLLSRGGTSGLAPALPPSHWAPIVTNLGWLFTICKFLDKMISSECLHGVPLLVLANKQDIPDCMGVREVKPIFNKNGHLIGRRDCMVMPVSALTG